MINFTELNGRKKIAWETKTIEEYTQWQLSFKKWFNEQNFNNKDKQIVKEQITALNEKKMAFFDKAKNKPQIVKNNYIFRPEEGEAFIALCDALTKYINNKIDVQYTENFK